MTVQNVEFHGMQEPRPDDIISKETRNALFMSYNMLLNIHLIAVVLLHECTSLCRE